MIAYEVISLMVDMGDLSQLNRFTQDGWMIVGTCSETVAAHDFQHRVLLQRATGTVTDSHEQTELLEPFD